MPRAARLLHRQAQRPFSIRNRVFLLALVALVVSSLGLTLFLHQYATRASDQAFDRLLAASALSIAGAVRTEDNHVTVELPHAAMAMLSSQQRVFYTVRDFTGNLVTGYDDLDADMPLAQSASPVFENRLYRGDAIRIGTLGRLVSINQQAQWVTIRVAETRDARQALAAEIVQRAATSLPIMAAITLILLWFGITRAFRPLQGIEQELRQRDTHVLKPLHSPAPREVERLVQALNEFMQRLQAMLSNLNSLVADAAHQVRTPLASLRAQAQVALEEPDPQRLHQRIARIHENATHASLLVNQLLMDATITHRLGSGDRSVVSMAQVVSEMRQRVGDVDGQRLHITMTPEARRLHMRGDRIALREMMRNLVDNALRHAPHGPVDISLTLPDPGRLLIEVRDHGPGIPEHEKARVVQRFARGQNATAPGSGLGLSIVAAVVKGHQGTLTLENRPGGGLRVQVTLPITPARLAGGGLSGVCLPLAGLVLGLLLSAPPATHAHSARPAALNTTAPQTTHYPAPQPERARLTIAGPTDTAVFSHLVRGFQQEYPAATVTYHEINSRDLYEQVVSDHLADTDVLISSAVDLQLRLANDGYARRHESAWTQRLPEWARWRSEVFGFTFEPIVMVYNTDRLRADEVPHSRPMLLRMLEEQEDRLYGRIGTYDIVTSSVGHLLATQDAMISSNFWGLANALGRAGVQLVGNTQIILDRIQAGQLDLGYNVLGSYVHSHPAYGKTLDVRVLDDYELVLSRAALIRREAPQPHVAGQFIDWLLSPTGQRVIEHEAQLGALPELDPDSDPAQTPSGAVLPIALNPTLLTGLDQQRHNRFLQNWLRLVTDTPVRARGMTGR